MGRLFEYHFLENLWYSHPQGVEVVLPLSGGSVPFTGRGLISLSLLEAATFIVEVPQDYQYELIIRYQVSLISHIVYIQCTPAPDN